jgi:PIN domain nuclease of toxin-antitoxin system
VRFLLDTHLLVWLQTDDERLTDPIRDIVSDARNSIFASVVSIWEVAIKWGLRHGSPNDMPFPASTFSEALIASAVAVLPSSAAHAVALDDLPLLHGDPFDRLLVATARSEGMTLLTRDAGLAQYGAGVRLF